MDFSDFEYHQDKIPADYKEKKRYFERLEMKFVEEISSSPAAADFFKGYNPDSIKNFVESYAHQKAQLAEIYNYYAEAEQRREFKFRDKAERVFNAIKQKKLFNLQLQWRAELVTIKEVDSTGDFLFWGRLIDDCSFLPEIVPADIEIMKQFLREEDAYRSIYETYCWQDYTLFVLWRGGIDDNLPEWYRFYDNRMGTGSLLLLPDKRRTKEAYYYRIAQNVNERVHNEEKNENPPAPFVFPSPYLHIEAENIYEFAKEYEKDKHFLKLFHIYYVENSDLEDREGEISIINDAIDILKDAEVNIVMPGGMDWRQAVVKCAQAYESEMIGKELDVLYSEYCMLRESGISGSKTREELKEEYKKDIHLQLQRNTILKGRELCGEPLDFNF